MKYLLPILLLVGISFSQDSAKVDTSEDAKVTLLAAKVLKAALWKADSVAKDSTQAAIKAAQRDSELVKASSTASEKASSKASLWMALATLLGVITAHAGSVWRITKRVAKVAANDPDVQKATEAIVKDELAKVGIKIQDPQEPKT